MSDHNLYPPVDPIKSGITGHCPRCGEGKLFNGFLTVAPNAELAGWIILLQILAMVLPLSLFSLSVL